MGTFPPMSNTAMREETGKCGEAALSTLGRGWPDEEEVKAVRDEILPIYQLVQENERTG